MEQNGKCGRFADVLGTLAMVFVLLAALALAVTSLFVSARIGPDQYSLLQVNLFEENEGTNLLIVAAGIAALALLGKIRVTKRFNRIFAAAALVVLGAFGVAWAASVNAHAESDGDVLIQIAEKLLAGDYTELATKGAYLHYYLVRFPYQCGLLSCLELLTALFGATGALGVARLINVFLLMSSYAAILLITDRLFRDERVTFVTILLLLACVQPVFSCTFVYGLVPAFALCSWTGYFVVRYLQTGKMRNMIPAVVFMAAAAYVRSNSWIVIIALSIVLLVHAIRRRRLAPVLLAAALVLAALPFPKLAQTAYEAKIGTSFGSGYPKSYWMAMSLQDGWKSTGWHVQAYQEEMESTYGEDVDAIDARAEADIRAGVAELAADPKAAGEYLLEKLTSMWDEPTFTCIWITKSVKSYAEPGALAQWVYGDGFDAAFRFAMKKAVMVLYAGFALCAFALLRRRADEQLLLPLIILGGVLFHLLFEAKSQYVLEYLPFFCPLAAYGILSFGRGAEERLCEAIRKRRSEKRVRIEQKTN